MAPKGYKVLKPVHPNAGIAAAYRAKLERLVRDMADSYEHWLRAAYRRNKPEMAQDAATPRVTAVEAKPIGASKARSWFVYVDGKLRMGKNGAPLTFKTREAAENAGLKAAGANAVLTVPVLFGDRLDARTLEALPLAQTAAETLQDALDQLGRRWSAAIDETAPRLARWFVGTAGRRSEAGFKQIMRDGGMTVRFQPTPAMRDVFNATIAENVGLIKSIGQQYHSEVQGLVMRSVAAGRDLGGLTRELERRYGVTRRRAAFIARDQNNKVTSSMIAVRQAENGIMAIWLHSHGGKEPRPTHLANSGKPYDPAVGWFDPDPRVRRRIRPGELINCRCVSKTIIKGLT